MSKEKPRIMEQHRHEQIAIELRHHLALNRIAEIARDAAVESAPYFAARRPATAAACAAGRHRHRARDHLARRAAGLGWHRGRRGARADDAALRARPRAASQHGSRRCGGDHRRNRDRRGTTRGCNRAACRAIYRRRTAGAFRRMVRSLPQRRRHVKPCMIDLPHIPLCALNPYPKKYCL